MWPWYGLRGPGGIESASRGIKDLDGAEVYGRRMA